MKEAKDVRILIVDDEKTFRDAMIFEFQRRGFQVSSAENGKKAFEQFQAHPVDVILTDVGMPVWDGIELLRQMKAKSPESPVVMLLTGYMDVTTEKAYDLGAEALFGKPFDRKALVSTIMRLVTPREERWSESPETVDLDAVVSICTPGEKGVLEAHSINLGRGGMFAALEKRFPEVGDEVTFKVAFDDRQPAIEGSGVVRWVRIKSTEALPSGCGIEFSYLSEKCRTQIIDLMSSRKPKPYIPHG